MIQHVNSENKYKDLFYANPFRYRGYYYDEEIELYYLQSRYYNPQGGRFVNADATTAVGNKQHILLSNLLIYCINNPILYTDIYGYYPSYYRAIFKALILNLSMNIAGFLISTIYSYIKTSK